MNLNEKYFLLIHFTAGAVDHVHMVISSVALGCLSSTPKKLAGYNSSTNDLFTCRAAINLSSHTDFTMPCLDNDSNHICQKRCIKMCPQYSKAVYVSRKNLRRNSMDVKKLYIG